MMKKRITGVLLLVAVMVFMVVTTMQAKTVSTVTTEIEQSSAVGMNLTGVNQSKRLDFIPKGTYHKDGFGETYFVYRFDSPYENIVVFRIGDSGYLVGKSSYDMDGVSYTTKCVKTVHQFVGLSDKYLLFITEDGMITVAFEEKTDVKVGESCYIIIPFEELSDEEKGDFIYPVSLEMVSQ